MTRPTGRTLTLLLGTGPQDGATVAALRLAEQVVARGHRVAVYAYGDGVSVGSEGSWLSDHATALLRRGIHGGLVSWVVDGAGARRAGTMRQVPGAVEGDGGDLWRFVRDADAVLGVAR